MKLCSRFIFPYDDKNINKNNAQKMKKDRERPSIRRNLRRLVFWCDVTSFKWGEFSRGDFLLVVGMTAEHTYPREELEHTGNKYVIGDFR